MTLVAIWYREQMNALYAVADSRMSVNGGGGVLTESAPKFFVCRVRCYGQDQSIVSDSEILIGYAGSASVAFSTIATIQNCLISLYQDDNKTLPTMLDVGNFIGRILKKNYLDFGVLWTKKAMCDLIVFGSLPSENRLRSVHIGCVTTEDTVDVAVTELPIVEHQLCCSFGSGSNYFQEKLLDDMRATGNVHPYNVISKIIANDERPDIGGHIQVAYATLDGATIPLIMVMDAIDEQKKDVVYLGRGSLDLGKVGNCSIGVVAIGNQ